MLIVICFHSLLPFWNRASPRMLGLALFLFYIGGLTMEPEYERNSEHYLDPTACEALRRIDSE